LISTKFARAPIGAHPFLDGHFLLHMTIRRLILA
jgi:hypothetical protein